MAGGNLFFPLFLLVEQKKSGRQSAETDIKKPAIAGLFITNSGSQRLLE
jgi:hypothetical protein